jgi:hypothetical protein
MIHPLLIRILLIQRVTLRLFSQPKWKVKICVVAIFYYLFETYTTWKNLWACIFCVFSVIWKIQLTSVKFSRADKTCRLWKYTNVSEASFFSIFRILIVIQKFGLREPADVPVRQKAATWVEDVPAVPRHKLAFQRQQQYFYYIAFLSFNI